MTQYLIMCRSLTYAQKSARLLERAGITAAVVKAPQNLSSGGCGYAVSVHRRQNEAVAVLKSRNIPIGKIYVKNEYEHYREVML